GEVDRLTNRRGLRGKAPLPVVEADHGDRRLAGLVILSVESPPQESGNTQHIKVASCDEIAVQQFRLAVHGDTHAAAVPGKQTRERLALITKLLKSQVA